ncbi:3-hydroxyacyl-CoA dehydrogenase NAD-binding domain-containing protein (plasmid) [Streptomyces sp. BI20]|uniref:3-hydroxyacyl-CoA dehydrogenase NAD-binding domain-containing protein n=1 Tax=Streptomyces sp. BI20 TaxID=3403460 RepID=UPI003C7324CC
MTEYVSTELYSPVQRFDSQEDGVSDVTAGGLGPAGERGRGPWPRLVTVVGTGPVGLGWIALFLGHGLRVRVHGDRVAARAAVLGGLDGFAARLPAGTVDPLGALDRLEFEPEPAAAVRDADVVVECLAEELGAKRELFGRIAGWVGPRALLLSSTGTFAPESLAVEIPDGGTRLVVAHPSDPGFGEPLVEVGFGERTSMSAVIEAVVFLESVRRVPVVSPGPVAGSVAEPVGRRRVARAG